MSEEADFDLSCTCCSVEQFFPPSAPWDKFTEFINLVPPPSLAGVTKSYDYLIASCDLAWSRSLFAVCGSSSSLIMEVTSQ